MPRVDDHDDYVLATENVDRPDRILVLDPASQAIPCCLWNDFIYKAPDSKGKHSYKMTAYEQPIALEEALAIWF